MNIKKIIAFLLCCGIVLCLSACESAGTSGNTSSVFNNPTIEKPKKFSNEAELREYANNFWICETDNNDSKTFKLRIFNANGICFSWDFSYASNETLEDCIKNVLKLSEEQGQSFRVLMDLLIAGLNVDGLKSKSFDIEYDANKSQINSNGQTYGTFLNDGSFKCDGDIYKSDVNKYNEFRRCFMYAKHGLIEEKYGEIANYKDVKYNPISYLGREFLITGTAELDDYYNYDYRDLEVVYFCICITPSGGSFSDRWYIYCDRDQYRELFEELKKGKVSNIALICRGYYPDSLKSEMANLVDYYY